MPTAETRSPIEASTDISLESIWRLTVDQYHDMLRLGILISGDPFELLEGWLVTMDRKSPQHSHATHMGRDALERLVPDGWHVAIHDSVTIEESEPEPDLSIVRGDYLDYMERHPGPAETPLVVEIADTSLGRDRGIKKRIYARAAIPNYWIVKLPERRVEVYSDPTGAAAEPDYRHRREYGPAEQIPVLIDGRKCGSLAAREFFA